MPRLKRGFALWPALACTGLHWLALACTGLQACTGLKRVPQRPRQVGSFDTHERPRRTHITNAFCASAKHYTERVSKPPAWIFLFALIKVAYFRISCFAHNLVMRVHEVRVLRSLVWKV
jgi:hypothetical protein